MKNKLPILIATFGLILGVFISILFGVNEGIFKNKIKRDLQLNSRIQSIADSQKKQAKIAKERSKNWRYYQRFHFHSTGIGAMSLGILILLGLCLAPRKWKLGTSYLVSISGFLYPFVWLFAAIYGPEIGRGAAKEKFAIFGYMGGLYLVGLIISLILFTKYPFSFQKDEI